jgi:hypothetical protein
MRSWPETKWIRYPAQAFATQNQQSNLQRRIVQRQIGAGQGAAPRKTSGRSNLAIQSEPVDLKNSCSRPTFTVEAGKQGAQFPFPQTRYLQNQRYGFDSLSFKQISTVLDTLN